MYLIYGESLRGKVDQVPGRFYVATRFFHMLGIPLFPAGTYLVWEGSEWKGAWTPQSLRVGRFNLPLFAGWERKGSFTGTRVRFSWKSFFVAWLRTVLVFIGCGTVLGPLLIAGEWLGPNENWAKTHRNAATQVALVESAVAAVAFALLWASFRLTRAGRRRALELEQAVGSGLLERDVTTIGHEQEQP
jgi:uncharacterized membrane protein YidH (DUF202 family)